MIAVSNSQSRSSQSSLCSLSDHEEQLAHLCAGVADIAFVFQYVATHCADVIQLTAVALIVNDSNSQSRPNQVQTQS